MIELLTVASIIGYIVYLKYYADQRSAADKQADQLREGIALYQSGQQAQALAYFNQVLAAYPTMGVAYLYRARIYRELGDPNAALNDLDTAKSYDDTFAALHLETGQLHFERGDYPAAFTDFDKAIFYGNTTDAYQWRGLTRQQLGQSAAAGQDLAKAEAAAAIPDPQLPVAPRRFLDRKLLTHAGLALLNAVLLVIIIKKTATIHWPYLAASASAAAIGFAEPRKGWVLALWQAALLLIGYYGIAGPAANSVDREVELFCLYGAVGLTFVGSFVGSLLKRAQA